MPDPLPADFAATLRSDPVAALAAAFIIETHHPNVLHWVARAVQPPERRRCKRKANGVHKLADAYLVRRRRKRDRDDEALVEAMRRNTEASIGDLATAVGKSRTSIVSALHRLRDQGLATSDGSRWALVEEPAPREPPVKWTAPLSASQRAHAHA